MYLYMIERSKEKEVFMKLANIVAISCCEEGVQDDDSSFCWPLSSYSKKVKIVDIAGWKPSTKEQGILKKYWNEMEADEDGVFGLQIEEYKIEEAIKELEGALKQVKSLDESARRKAIVEKLVDDLVAWDKVSDITPKVSKIMMLELLALAMVDGDYAELEKFTIKIIATKLDVDDEELEEMEEFITSYMNKFSEGLEIITA